MFSLFYFELCSTYTIYVLDEQKTVNPSIFFVKIANEAEAEKYAKYIFGRSVRI